MSHVAVDSTNFQSEVLDVKDKLVIVDFWADWCGPCHMLAPIIDEVSSEYEGKIKVGKLDVDSASDIASKYNVMGIPTVIFFKNGKEEKRLVGVQPKQKYTEQIEALM